MSNSGSCFCLLLHHFKWNTFGSFTYRWHKHLLGLSKTIFFVTFFTVFKDKVMNQITETIASFSPSLFATHKRCILVPRWISRSYCDECNYYNEKWFMLWSHPSLCLSSKFWVSALQKNSVCVLLVFWKNMIGTGHYGIFGADAKTDIREQKKFFLYFGIHLCHNTSDRDV